MALKPYDGDYDPLPAAEPPKLKPFAGGFDPLPQPAAPAQAEPAPADDSGDFMRGLKRTLPELKQLAGGTLAAVGDATGLDSVRDYGLGVYKAQQDKLAPLARPTDSASEAYKRVKQGDLGAGVDFLQNAAGYTLGQAGESLAAAGAGALLGSEVPVVGNVAGAIGGFLGKGVVKSAVKKQVEKIIAEQVGRGVAKDVAEQAGAKYVAEQAGKKTADVLGEKAVKRIGGVALGAQAMNTVMELGSVYPEAVNQAQEQGRQLTGGEKAKAVGASLAAAGLESVADLFNLGVLFRGVKGAGEAAAKAGLKAAAKAYAGRAAIAGTEGALREAGTEAAQTGLERFGASQSLTDADAMRDYIDSAAVGAVGGVLFGGAAAFHNAGNEKAQPKPFGQDPADKARADLIEAQASGDPTAADAAVDNLNAVLQGQGRAAPAAAPLGPLSRVAAQVGPSFGYTPPVAGYTAPTFEPFPGAQPGTLAGAANIVSATLPSGAAPININEAGNNAVVNTARRNNFDPAREASAARTTERLLDEATQRGAAVLAPSPEEQAAQDRFTAKLRELPPAGMDPATGEIAAPPSRDPAALVDYLVQQKLNGNRIPGVTELAKVYGLAPEAARALRKQAIAQITTASLPEPDNGQRITPDTGEGAVLGSGIDEPVVAGEDQAGPALAANPRDDQAAQGDTGDRDDTGDAERQVADEAAGARAEGLNYDTSDQQEADDIVPPSGSPYTLKRAAELEAGRRPNAKVFEVEGGFVVRESRQAPAGEAATVPSGEAAPTAAGSVAAAPQEKPAAPATAPPVGGEESLNQPVPDVPAQAPPQSSAQDGASPSASDLKSQPSATPSGVAGQAANSGQREAAVSAPATSQPESHAAGAATSTPAAAKTVSSPSPESAPVPVGDQAQPQATEEPQAERITMRRPEARGGDQEVEAQRVDGQLVIRNGAGWSVAKGPLEDGTYTASVALGDSPENAVRKERERNQASVEVAAEAAKAADGSRLDKVLHALNTHPEKALGLLSPEEVRAVGKAMGRKFSPKASPGAILERLSEGPRTDTIKAMGPAIRAVLGEKPAQKATTVAKTATKQAASGSLAPVEKTSATERMLNSMGQGGSVPVNRQPWTKLAGRDGKWSDGNRVVTAKELAAMMDRKPIEGEARRVNAGNLPTTGGLNVRMGGQVFPINGLAEAQRNLHEYRERAQLAGFGASGTPAVDIVNDAGKVVAHFSYNGRIWEGPRGTNNPQEIVLPGEESAKDMFARIGRERDASEKKEAAERKPHLTQVTLKDGSTRTVDARDLKGKEPRLYAYRRDGHHRLEEGAWSEVERRNIVLKPVAITQAKQAEPAKGENPANTSGWTTEPNGAAFIVRDADGKRVGEILANSPAQAIADLARSESRKPTPANKAEPQQGAGQPGNPAEIMQAQKALFARLRRGEASLDDYKAGWEALQANRDALLAHLGTMTKSALLDFAGPRYKNDPKDRVVRAAMDGLESQFQIGRSLTYTIGGAGMSGHAQALQGLVDKTTEADLAAYAKDHAEARAQREAAVAGMENPQTLDDFARAARALGTEEKLTPAQRLRFDALRADARREQRDAEAKRNAVVRQVDTGSTGMTLVETKHTQKGHDLFVVRMDDRVERDVYNSLNIAAKRLGGHYSSFRGNGAIPGFTFTTRDAAEQFMAVREGNVDTSAQQEARAEAKADRRAETLGEKADALREKAQASLDRDRKDNTARRAAQAASAEADARKQLALADTMTRLAQAIEAGKAKMLAFVRHKSQVELLERMLYDAHQDYLRAQGVRWEKAQEMPLTADSLVNTKLPQFRLSRGDAIRVARRLQATRGGKALGTSLAKEVDYGQEYAQAVQDNPLKFVQMKKRADGQGESDFAFFPTKTAAQAAVNATRSAAEKRGLAEPQFVVVKMPRAGKTSRASGDWAVALSPELAIERKLWEPDYDKKVALNPTAAGKIMDLLKVSDRGDSDVPYVWAFYRERRGQLAKLGIETNYELREALREYLALRQAPAGEDTVRKLERALVGRKDVGNDFFPTPPAVVQRLIEQADIGAGMRVLEPSAGKGDIAEAARDAAENVTVDTVEMSGTLREILEAKGFDAHGEDFLQFSPAEGYDRIVMNPPFGNDNGASHVRHAYSLLKPGGRLVAVMGNGARGAEAFTTWLDKVGGLAEPLPEGSFKSSFRPTGVATQVVVIDRGNGPLESTAPLENAEPATRAVYENRIDALFAGRQAQRPGVRVLDSSDVLSMLGHRPSPLLLQESKVVTDGKHALTAADWKKVPQWIENPVAVFDSATVAGRLVFIAPDLVNGAPVRIVVEPGTGSTTNVHLLVNAYDTPGAAPFKQWAKDGRLRYLDTKQSPGWMDRSGLQLPRLSTPARGSVRKVLTEADLVKSKAERGGLENAEPATPAVREAAVQGQPLFNTEQGTELSDADLTPEERASFARQREQSEGNAAERELAAQMSREEGEADAQRLGLRKAVDKVLGPAGVKVVFLRDLSGLPADMRSTIENRNKGRSVQTTALYDPVGETAYIFTSRVRDPHKAMWEAAHEIAGHHGLRKLLGKNLDRALELALTNDTVAKVATAIGKERNSTDRLLMAEEALAELQAAIRTGNFAQIEARYGVPVPQGIRANLKQAIADFLRRLKNLLNRLAGNDVFTDEDVRGLLDAARAAADGEGAVTGSVAESTAPDQTQTAAFQRWFGDSKVVDADGKPLVVYHGTNAEFDAFDPAKVGSAYSTDDQGFFFTSREDEAEKWAEKSPAKGLPKVLPVYLQIENAWVINAPDGMGPVEFFESGKGVFNRGHGAAIQYGIDSGYDGMIVHGDGESLYIAFRPEQIKSATANNGNFDAGKPSILESVEPASSRRFTETPADVVADIEAVMQAGSDKSLLQKARERVTAFLKNPAKTVASLKDETRWAWLAGLTTDMLATLGSDYNGNMAHYDHFLKEMNADRNALQQQGEELAETVRQWGAKNADEAKTLFKLMHQATVDGVDPAKEYEPLQFRYSGKLHEVNPKNIKAAIKAINQQMRERSGDPKQDMIDEKKRLKAMLASEPKRRALYPTLKQKWEALTPEAQQHYIAMRDMYAARSKMVEDGLIARIEDTDAPANHKRKLIAVIRSQFETQRLQGVYFPLQRFGQYFVAAEKAGESTFLMFESLAKLEAGVASLRQRGFTINAQGLKSQGKAADAPSGTFVAEVIQIMRSAHISEATQDNIYQLYLQSLPELSLRKHAIHRRAVPGFDPDAVRGFAFNMLHGAHQIARLRYAHKLADTITLLRQQQEAARKEPEADTRKVAAMDAILNELDRRHQWIMNPTDSKATGLVSSFGFAYYLGLTPAAALVNMTQTALLTFPYLAARHGPVRAMNHLFAGLRDTVRTGGHIQKVLRNADEARMHEELQRRGTLDKTQAYNLAGIAEGGLSGHNPQWAKAMSIIGLPFHKAEVFNREASAIAAYRLAREDGKSHEEAVDLASRAVNDTHFDYTNQNRARIMQSGTAKTLLMFRQYSLNMTWHMGRMLWQATKNADPQTRSIARRNMAGVLGMSALFSGTLGLPMMSVTFGVLNAIAASLGDDDEPWDAETEFRAFLNDMLGEGAAEVAVDGALNALTGADVASRVSLSQLWFRDADRELDGRGAYYNLLEQAAGPMGGVLKNALVGKQMIDEGHVQRGIETMLPKAMKDTLRAQRYAVEGVNNLRGDPLVADVSLRDTLLQLSGFTPAKVAHQYDVNRSLKNYEQAILDRRGYLLDAFAMAVRMEDDEARQEVLDKIRAFNQTNPEIAITTKGIRQSLGSRARYSRDAEHGITLNKRLAAKVHAAVEGEG